MDERETETVVDAFSAECIKMQEMTVAYRKAEAELKDSKRDLDRLSSELAAKFVERGMQNIKLAKGGTLYLNRKPWFRKRAGMSQPEGVAACREAGLEEFVSETYDPKLLKALVLERLDEMPEGTLVEDAVPEALREVFEAGDTTVVTLLKK